MCLKKIIFILSMTIYTFCSAMPPYKVVQSCREEKAYNEKITYKWLEGGYFTPFKDPECNDVIYNIGEENDEHFQHLMCGEKDFLIIHGRRIDLASAMDLSVTGVVYPHYLISHVSAWSRITYENKDWLCISGPLSQSGYGAANLQYYIVEHAFEENSTPSLYFYFFNKEIHSWIATMEKKH